MHRRWARTHSCVDWEPSTLRGAPEDLIAFATGAEELGLGQLWLIEDCFLASGMILAASALAVTSRIGVGVGLLPVPLRNPPQAAMEIASFVGGAERAGTPREA